MNRLGWTKRRWMIGVLIAFVSSSFYAVAESKPKKSKPAEAPAASAPAMVRIWKGNVGADRPLRLAIRGGRKPAGEIRLDTGIQFLDYQETPLGAVTILLLEDGDEKTPIATTNTTFEAGDFVTLLIDETSGHLGVEIIDDSILPGATTGELSVRCLAQNLTSLRIKIGDELDVKLGGASPLAHLRGLVSKTLQVDTSATDSSGKQISWSNEIDFRKNPRATLLVVPDAYGRIRPRVVVDGAAH